MLKNITRLEQIIEGRVYHFTCDNDSPINHCKEAIARFLAHCVQISNQAEEQEKLAKEQSKVEAMSIPVEEINPDVSNQMLAEECHVCCKDPIIEELPTS